jgi:hypothetical protein
VAIIVGWLAGFTPGRTPSMIYFAERTGGTILRFLPKIVRKDAGRVHMLRGDFSLAHIFSHCLNNNLFAEGLMI